MHKIYALLLAALLLTGCAHEVYTPLTPSTAYINSDAALLYKSLAPTAPAVTSLGRNEPVMVVGKKDDSWSTVKFRKKTYYVRTALLTTTAPTPSSIPSSSSGSSTYGGSYHNIQTGPRGGKYYINSNGNKTYVKHK